MRKTLAILMLVGAVAYGADVLINPTTTPADVELADLSDVAPLTGATNGDVLAYNGAAWTNSPAVWVTATKAANQDNITAITHVKHTVDTTRAASGTTAMLDDNFDLHFPSAGDYLITAWMETIGGDGDTRYTHSIYVNSNSMANTEVGGQLSYNAGSSYSHWSHLSYIYTATSTNDFVYHTMYTAYIGNTVDIIGGAHRTKLQIIKLK